MTPSSSRTHFSFKVQAYLDAPRQARRLVRRHDAEHNTLTIARGRGAATIAGINTPSSSTGRCRTPPAEHHHDAMKRAERSRRTVESWGSSRRPRLPGVWGRSAQAGVAPFRTNDDEQPSISRRTGTLAMYAECMQTPAHGLVKRSPAGTADSTTVLLTTLLGRFDTDRHGAGSSGGQEVPGSNPGSPTPEVQVRGH